MNTVAFSQKGDPGNRRTSEEEIQGNIHAYQHEINEINIMDGSEFLDDSIRMKDQPLGETTVKENE